MKFILFTVLLLAIASCKIGETTEINELDLYGEGSIIDGLNCVRDVRDVIQASINLSKQVGEGNYIGIIKDAIQIIESGIQALIDCQSLFCWQPTFRRCQNENPGNECEKYGLLVYPQCGAGFTNWLCCVCATECPEGFRDDGLYCAKPEPYGRGAGYPLWARGQCESENPQGCEQNGALWYPKCREGYHAAGCCICSPNCPEGYTDIGVSCQKPESYGRGVGYPISFGAECLLYNAADEFTGECSELQSYINQLADSTDVYFNSQMDTDEIEYPDLGGTIQALGQFTQRYLDTCYVQPEQVA